MSIHDRVIQAQAKAIANAQSRTISTLLPDICTLQPVVKDNRTVNRYGITQGDVPALRTYNGISDIPCRADEQRSFRPDELDYQPSQVDEIDLHLPHDVTMLETDIVTLNGHEYSIRKLIDDSEYDVTKIAKIMRVTTEGVK